MIDEVVYLTREGLRKFESELNYLRTVRRSEVADRLRQALEEGGDLTENAEYEAAKNDQAFVEGRIQQLEMLLSRASIIDGDEPVGPRDVVSLNTIVTVQEEGQEPDTFHIVGSAEADPRAGRISDASPLGRALLGRQVGDLVKVDAPDGQFTYRIVAIEEPHG